MTIAPLNAPGPSQSTKAWFNTTALGAIAFVALCAAPYNAVAAPPPPVASVATPVSNGPTPAVLTPVEISLIKKYLFLDPIYTFGYEAPILPAYYDTQVRQSDNSPPGNPVTAEGASLGRVLFYDKSLSSNGAVSCASCHSESLGFTDIRRFSLGVVAGSPTTAHAMRLGNIRYYKPGSMFWNRRAASVEAQATQPVQSTVEMGFDVQHGGMTALLSKMQNLPYYPVLFKWVFGSPAVTEARIQKALAQFERAMVSTGSAWDSGYAKTYNPALPDKGLGLDVPGLTERENQGRKLFMSPPAQGGLGCAGCHEPPTFALNGNSLGNGLDAGNATVFKSPSLKNVALGKAFMHDGRFATLEQVVDHYDHGVKAGPALDRRLMTPAGQPRVLNLSVADKAAMVAFLKSLTDTQFLGDPKFSDPFRAH